MNRAVYRERGWRSSTEHEARVCNAVRDYVVGKRDGSHRWPSLERVATSHGWASGFTLADASLMTFGVRPYRIWQECQAAGTLEPLYFRLVRAW